MKCVCILLVLLVTVYHSSGWRLQTKLMMAQNDRLPGRVFVAGGSRGAGLRVVKKLSSLGTKVNVLVRQPHLLLNDMPGVKVHVGDVLDVKSLNKAMTGCVAAITTVGGDFMFQYNYPPPQRVDYLGNSNVAEQAGILGMEKFILVSSIGCGNSKNAMHPEQYESLEPILIAKTLAERHLEGYTSLDWTIIRPGALTDDSGLGNAILTEDPNGRGHIDRGDLADLIIRVLYSPKGLCTGKTLTALDPTIPPYSNRPGSPFVKPFEVPKIH